MKKGLRQGSFSNCPNLRLSKNPCPDEEGIKTAEAFAPIAMLSNLRILALMKKGLRLIFPLVQMQIRLIPLRILALMKKGLRLIINKAHLLRWHPLRILALMKKGLRHAVHSLIESDLYDSKNPCPDEEGIKTLALRPSGLRCEFLEKRYNEDRTKNESK